MLLKNKRFSADGQNTAQNYTTMGVVVTMQFQTTVSPSKEDLKPILRKEIMQFQTTVSPSEEDLKPILHKEIEISSSVTEKGEVCWS